MTARTHSRYSAALALALVLAGTSLTPALAAQEGSERRPAPLAKSDLARLLSGTTYTRDEVVAIIERSCLSFEPTEGDLADLRRLGATDPVIAAIAGCAAPLVARASRTQLAASVGGTVSLTVDVRRGGTPRSGIRLSLLGSEEIPGEPAVLSTVTDGSGVALFRIPAGTAAGVRVLRLAASGETLEGDTRLTLRVAPGPPVRAVVLPSELRVTDAGAPLDLEAIAFDRFGNRIPRAVLSLRPRATAAGAAAAPPFTATTRTANASGVAAFRIDSTEGLDGFDLEIGSAGVTLATIPVAFEASEGRETVEVEAPPEPAVPGREAPVLRPAEPAATEPAEAEETRDPDATPAGPLREPAAGEPAGAEPAADSGAPADPGDVGARRTAAAAALEAGDARTAVGLLQGVVSLEPESSASWLELGRAWAVLGEEREARRALRRAAELNPELAAEVRSELDLLRPVPPWLQLDLWGGTSIETARTSGLVMVQATVWPVPFLRIWGRYDDAAGLGNPLFVRRSPDIESFYGGGGVEWGPERRLGTTFEVGRRNQTRDLYEYVYHAEQSVRLDGGGRVAFGGYFGRWFDRDDWVGYGRADLRVSPGLAVRPAVYVGETVTSLPDAVRLAEREVRGYLGIAFFPSPRVEIEPAIGVGSLAAVDVDADALDGTLIDAQLKLAVGFGAASRLQLFVRHQRPPGGGDAAFTSVVAGLALGLERTGGR